MISVACEEKGNGLEGCAGGSAGGCAAYLKPQARGREMLAASGETQMELSGRAICLQPSSSRRHCLGFFTLSTGLLCIFFVLWFVVWVWVFFNVLHGHSQSLHQLRPGGGGVL